MSSVSLVNLAHAHKNIILGIHPYKSVSKLQNHFNPIVKLLSEKTNKNIQLSIAKDYQTHIDLIGKDKIDFAYMGPAPYVALVNKYGQKRILARLVINGKPTFKGEIIARSDSAIKKLVDFKNRNFAFGDQKSTMSHLVPRYMLIKQGVTQNTLKKMSFLGSHDNVAIAVLSGAYDGGAVKEAVYQKYKDKGLKSVSSTPLLSEHLFVASNKVPDEVFEMVKKIMLDLKNHAQGKDAMKSIKKTMTAMGEAEDKDYDNLRVIMDLLSDKKVIK